MDWILFAPQYHLLMLLLVLLALWLMWDIRRSVKRK